MLLPSRYRRTTIITRGNERYFGGRPPVDTSARMDDVYVDVLSGDSWQSIAHRTLGDFRLWWVVADFNLAMNPLVELVPGTTLRVPSRGRLWMEILT